jgi:transcriptional regulator with XRE-family HTH domain
MSHNACYSDQKKLILPEIELTMGRKATALLPKHARIVSEVGENLRLARLRRRLSAQQVADRAGISRSTLQSLESGSSSVATGNLLQVLVVLGLEKDFLTLAAADPLGRKLEDARLTETRQRAPKRRKEEPRSRGVG